MSDETQLLHRNTGKYIPLAGRNELFVGRLYHDIEVVNDENCSRKHFSLTKEASGWNLTNLSNYGTVVNGKLLAVNDKVPLSHQDSIQASKQEFMFLENAAATVPPSMPHAIPRMAQPAMVSGSGQVEASKGAASGLFTKPSTLAGSNAVKAITSVGQWIFRESRQVVISFTRHVKRLFGSASQSVKIYKLQEEARKAKLGLGRRCYESGLADHETTAKVKGYETKINELKATNKSTRNEIAEIDKLLLALGASVLANNTEKQSIHTEFTVAKEAEKAVQARLGQKGGQVAGKETLDKYEPVRVGIAYGIIAVLLFLLFNMRGTPESQISSITQEDKLTKAVGLVVCGMQAVEADGATRDYVLSSGSCFAINSNGYLLTNKHVIEKTWNLMNATLLLDQIRKEKLIEIKPSVWVFFGGEKHLAEITHVSDKYDMAILKTSRRNTSYFKLGDADHYRRGTRVVAAGFPASAQQPLSVEEAVNDRRRHESVKKVESWFKPRDFEFITTDGTISRLTTEEGEARRWVQHNASINPGNSGGALVLENGTVIGINTLGATNASGTFYSLSLTQMKAEIEKVVPGVFWE